METKLNQLNQKLEADKGLVEKIVSLETADEVQKFLNSQGLEFSLEEINTLKDALVKAAAKSGSGELSDTDLEDVAGGSVGSVIDSVIDTIGNAVKIFGRRW